MVIKKKVISKTAKVVAKKSLTKKTGKKKIMAKKAVKKTDKPIKKSIKKAVKKSIKKAIKKPKTMEKKVAVKKIKKKAPVKKAVKKSLKVKVKTTAKKKPVVVKKPKVIAKKQKAKKTSVISAGTLFVGDIAPYQPKKREAYMSKGMAKHFRLLLEMWKQELMEKADLTMNQLKEDAVNYADPNDRASQEEGFSLELRARDRERKLIRKIEETLDLIDSSEYGFCKECGEEIGLRRLEARPTASLCVDCKTLDEIKEKQTGV